jgi:hypothetical protein
MPFHSSEPQTRRVLTALDAVALGIAQLIASEYEPTGIILNAADWWSTKLMLAKNSQNEPIAHWPPRGRPKKKRLGA